MDAYIKNWNNIIMNGSFDNTYKIAWAKALVELQRVLFGKCYRIDGKPNISAKQVVIVSWIGYN